MQYSSGRLALLHRYNQELEEDSAAREQERAQLQRQAESLARRLEEVLQEKAPVRAEFDAETPIDKTMTFLQDIIKVSCARQHAHPQLSFISH